MLLLQVAPWDSPTTPLPSPLSGSCPIVLTRENSPSSATPARLNMIGYQRYPNAIAVMLPLLLLPTPMLRERLLPYVDLFEARHGHVLWIEVVVRFQEPTVEGGSLRARWKRRVEGRPANPQVRVVVPVHK